MDWSFLTWTLVGSLLGGLGLLLLGMEQMTAGLRVAAGRSLHALLSNWTSSKPRGFASGVLLTAIVQSSSAVTVATIGFANAGLLTLGEAAWVVFGSNVGTTMTGWLVATVGLKLKITSLALPFLGIGMALRILRPERRLGGIGGALAGFGALFLGLAFLKEVFAGVEEEVDLTFLAQLGPWGLLVGVGVGATLTMVMQSSSAALALVLTACSQGVLSLELGGAMVVGANVGTTSTALLATMGATSNAKRVASIHVFFNLLTGLFATALLLPFLHALVSLTEGTEVAQSAATRLAIFHTAFNVLGVLLMWPLSNWSVGLLERRFTTAEEEESRPRHLDANVLNVPDVAMSALVLELQRAGRLALRTARMTLDYREVPQQRRRRTQTAARLLLFEIDEFASRLGRSTLPPEIAEALLRVLRVEQHYLTILRLSSDVAKIRRRLEAPGEESVTLRSRYVGSVRTTLVAADTADPNFDPTALRARFEAQERRRAVEKRHVLSAGIDGRRTSAETSLLIQQLSQVRRIAHQASDAGHKLFSLMRFVKEIRRARQLDPTLASEFEDEDPLAEFVAEQENGEDA